jgi:HEPN domain-containing protein
MLKLDTSEANRFYKVAVQMSDHAEFLLEGGRPWVAIYLAGYAVECILKAYILDKTPSGDHKNVISVFKKAGHGHDFDWLKEQYSNAGGPPFPPAIEEQFSNVSSWSPEFRYEPGMIDPGDAEAFVASVLGIIRWFQQEV